MQVFRPFSVTFAKAFLNIIVRLIQLVCPGLLVHRFIANQRRIHEEYQFFIRSVLSKHYYVSFTDNVSVPPTLYYSVNPGFAKLVVKESTVTNLQFIITIFPDP